MVFVDGTYVSPSNEDGKGAPAEETPLGVFEVILDVFGPIVLLV